MITILTKIKTKTIKENFYFLIFFFLNDFFLIKYKNLFISQLLRQNF